MNSAFLQRRRKRLPSPSSLTRLGTGVHPMCPRQQERNDQQSLGRYRMHSQSFRFSAFALRQSATLSILLLLLLFTALSCSTKPDPTTLVMIIESSPTNLDPRVGIDAQSERIDNLIFDDLLSRGNDLNVAPGLAEKWEVPDPLTYVFHIHRGVSFHDGRPLTARDVKWTFDSLLQG